MSEASMSKEDADHIFGTDIVEQLRKHHKDIGLPDSVESWLTFAADEIERLRAELKEAKQ